MIVYIFKRIALFIPTLILVSMLAFGLSRLADGDMTDSLLSLQGLDSTMEDYEHIYEKEYKKAGRHKPTFYLSLRPNYVTHDINSIVNPQDRAYVQKLIDQRISSEYAMRRLNLSNIGHLENTFIGPPDYNKVIEISRNTFHYPTLKWHGFDNQYHNWMSKVLTGDFGVSKVDGQTASSKIWSAMRWTLLILSINIFLTLMLSIPYGLYTGLHIGGRFDRWSGTFLFAIFSMPTFWIATVMVMFFTTSEFGMKIFPSIGMWYQSSDTSFWDMMSKKWTLLILPLLIIVLKDLGYLGRMVRDTVATESKKQYATTALAKGLSKRQYAFKHILPNSLTPAITLAVGAIPGAFTGVLLMEVIFNIPGMGRLMYTSIASADWDIVYVILLMTAVVTAFFYLLGDVLIAWLNPKIKL